MSTRKTVQRWAALVGFGVSAILLFAGNLVCLINFIHSGHFVLKSPEDLETTHFGAGAIALMALGFLMAAVCLVGAISFFREREDR